MNALKKWLADSGYELAADASETDVKSAAKKAIGDGKLEPEQYAKMLQDEVDAKKSAQQEFAGTVAGAVVQGLTPLFEKLVGAVTPAQSQTEETDTTDEEDAVTKRLQQVEDMAQRAEQRLKEFGQKPVGNDGASAFNGYDILKQGAGVDTKDPIAIRVKSAVERFDSTTSEARYTKGPFRGQRMQHNGVSLDLPSQRQKAMWAAWFKFDCMPEMMTQHDRDMVAWIIHNEKFYVPNSHGDSSARKLTEEERYRVWNGDRLKASLLDDSTSGGENAVPEFFDTQAIILPVLGMEVAPLVTIVDVPRGSSADTFTIGNPTLGAETEGSAITPFDATTLIANHDTSFFRVAGAIDIGQNFLLDAVPGMAQMIQDRYTAVHGTWLDQQILTGDGTTEPQGITVASGTVDITLATPTTGPWTISDVINLFFGVTKAYRQQFPSAKIAFAMVEQSYKRIRSIATGVTGDTRLIFGTDTGDGGLDSFTLFGKKTAIEENGMTGADAIFGQFGGYRLYRRQGLRFRRSQEGRTNLLANTTTVVADARYGGQVDRGAYFAVLNSAPTS